MGFSHLIVVKLESFKKKYAFMHIIGGIYKLTEAAIDNGYIDQLVIKYILQNIGLEILASAPEQEMPAIFLDKIGWGQKKDYIENTSSAYLSGMLPIDKFYVFTPEDGFKYENVNGRITNVGIRSSKDVATFNDALRDIVELADADRSSGRQTIANILFFDKVSRDKFEEALKRKLKEKSGTLPRKGSEKKEIPYSVASQQLNVPNYGNVTLFTYTIK